MALNFGLTYPQKARTLILAGVGTGSANPEAFRRRCEGLIVKVTFVKPPPRGDRPLTCSPFSAGWG